MAPDAHDFFEPSPDVAASTASPSSSTPPGVIAWIVSTQHDPVSGWGLGATRCRVGSPTTRCAIPLPTRFTNTSRPERALAKSAGNLDVRGRRDHDSRIHLGFDVAVPSRHQQRRYIDVGTPPAGPEILNDGPPVAVALPATSFPDSDVGGQDPLSQRCHRDAPSTTGRATVPRAHRIRGTSSSLSQK